MQLVYWSLGIAPALLNMVAAAPAEQLGHIVVLKPDLETKHIDQHIDWVNEMHKGTVSGRDNENPGQGIEHTFRSDDIGFHGYSGKFSDEVLKQIKEHEHVDFVEENRSLSLPETERREEGQGENEKSGQGENEKSGKGENEKPGKGENEKPGKVDTSSTIVGNQNTNPSVGLLTLGQGYNTFLEKGKIVDAVIWPQSKKRAEANAPAAGAGNGTIQAETVFNFTAPTTNVEDFEGVDAKEYFEVPEVDEIEARIAAELKKLEEERKRQKEEKAKLLGSNDLQRRAENTNPNCPGTYKKKYEFVENYNSYLNTLGISGGATLSGWGQSASLSGNYLNQAKFSQKSLTYVAFLDIEKQSTTPAGFEINKARYKRGKFAKIFGDRWIHGFKTGGKMIARVTFTSKDDTKSKDLKTHAEAALSFWGVSGELNLDVKKDIEEANKHMNVEASLFYQGELGIFMGDKEGSPKDIPSGSAEAVLGQVKSWSDKFESAACQHKYAYGPLLDQYDTVPGFDDLEDDEDYEPEVPNYDTAHFYALEILALMVKVEEQKNVLTAAKTIDEDKKLSIKSAAIDMLDEGKKWVKTVEKNPTKAKASAKALFEVLKKDFFDMFKEDVENALRVTDSAGLEKCKALRVQKVKECTSSRAGSGNDSNLLGICQQEGQDVFDKCKSGSL